MRFKEWLLNEYQWITLPEGGNLINGILMDRIDFRFEDWKKGANPKKSDTLIPIVDGTRWARHSAKFSAPLSNGTYLNVSFMSTGDPFKGLNYDQFKMLRSAGKLPKIDKSPTEDISIARKPENEVLDNPNWFRFALGMLGPNIVKMPEWAREEEMLAPLPQTRTG